MRFQKLNYFFIFKMRYQKVDYFKPIWTLARPIEPIIIRFVITKMKLYDLFLRVRAYNKNKNYLYHLHVF